MKSLLKQTLMNKVGSDKTKRAVALKADIRLITKSPLLLGENKKKKNIPFYLKKKKHIQNLLYVYLPIVLHVQDVTQGQFLSLFG